MPVKTLPKKLVARLKKASRVINGYLGRMKNIDHRRNDPVRIKEMEYLEISPKDTESIWGGRVRQMNVSRNYPGVELVIKRPHNEIGSSEELKEIKARVKYHNRWLNNSSNAKRKNYVLREPIAYDIGNGLIAMAKTNKPSLNEILGNIKELSRSIVEPSSTIRGIQFFRKLSKKHKKITRKQLKDAAIQVCKETKIWPINILLLGVNKKGQFIFMPLVDLK